MQKLPFGRTGHESSRVIFGAAALGRMRQEKADALLELLLAHGVNHIDTAAAYGESELRVGTWMRSHRDRFFLATKTGERTAEGARAGVERSRQRFRETYPRSSEGTFASSCSARRVWPSAASPYASNA